MRNKCIIFPTILHFFLFCRIRPTYINVCVTIPYCTLTLHYRTVLQNCTTVHTTTILHHTQLPSVQNGTPCFPEVTSARSTLRDLCCRSVLSNLPPRRCMSRICPAVDGIDCPRPTMVVDTVTVLSLENYRCIVSGTYIIHFYRTKATKSIFGDTSSNLPSIQTHTVLYTNTRRTRRTPADPDHRA